MVSYVFVIHIMYMYFPLFVSLLTIFFVWGPHMSTHFPTQHLIYTCNWFFNHLYRVVGVFIVVIIIAHTFERHFLHLRFNFPFFLLVSTRLSVYTDARFHKCAMVFFFGLCVCVVLLLPIVIASFVDLSL